MCGICGTFAYGGGGIDVAVQRAVRDHMEARGPNGSGEWMSPAGHVWLGHRRLAIIDLSPAGAQPMASADGKVVLTFNGEIYNYKELRERLQKEGCIFRSTSDTEVIIQLYRQRGPGFVSELRGMFAFALWDETRQVLVAARDPYGIKPFYYCDAGGRFTFASQVKALVVDPSISRRPDPAGVVGFFVFGSVPEPYTTYAAVKSLPAGTTLVIDRKGAQASRGYHSISAAIRAGEEAAAGGLTRDAVSHFREVLLDSVRHHLVADVPVGAFLSGGIDSGAIVGLMRDAGQQDIRTVTLSFDEFGGSPNDEAALGSETARRYETTHTVRRVAREEFEADLPKIMAAMDQPTVDGINTWFVSKAAHELGLRVAVSGIGGDELLGGYDTFWKLPQLVRWTQFARHLPALANIVEHGVDFARGLGLSPHPKWRGLARFGGTLPGAYLLQRGLFLPQEVAGVLRDADFVRQGLETLQPDALIAKVLDDGPRTDFGKVAALESSLYLRNQLLRDADWAAMAHSLEIRTPLVDHVLLRATAEILSSPGHPGGKSLLAAAPRIALPDSVVNREKNGFAIPVDAWIGARRPEHSNKTAARTVFSRGWAVEVATLQNVLGAAAREQASGLDSAAV